MEHRKKNTLKACFLQILLGSKHAAAVWQGVYNKLAALLPYGAKSPRKSSEGHRSFAINSSQFGVRVAYRCYTNESYAEMAL